MKKYEVYDIRNMIWGIIDELTLYGVDCSSFVMPEIKWTGLKNGYGKTVLYNDGSMTIRLSYLLREVNDKKEYAVLYNTVVHELFHVLDKVKSSHKGYWFELANIWNKNNPDCIIQEFGTNTERKIIDKKKSRFTICIDGETYHYASKCGIIKSAMANKPLYLDGKEYNYTLYEYNKPIIKHFVQN